MEPFSPGRLSHLLSSQSPEGLSEGYDAVILSDLLHFDQSHAALLDSVCMLLARRPTARVYVAAGVYTKSDICSAFLRQAEQRGLVWVDRGAGPDGQELDEVWRGTLPVLRISREQLGVRKGMCRWWVGQWSDEHL
jgi:EEF1A N-terminal glycine/lysine methyltransferase